MQQQVEKLFGYDFIEFSRPIENEWLESIIKKNKQIAIIGSGVTSKEYACILANSNIKYEILSPEYFYNNTHYFLDKYSILACPREMKKVISVMNYQGQSNINDYNTFYQLIRNRTVFDFRKLNYDHFVDLILFKKCLLFICNIKTMGGIDFLTSSKSISRINELLLNCKFLTNNFHKKITIELQSHFELNHLDLDGIDLLEIIVRFDSLYIFKKYLEFEIENCIYRKKIHIVFIDIPTKELNINSSYSFACEFNQPIYYDYEYQSRINSPVNRVEDNKFAKCLSRRLFPIFDERLKFKLCSLYEKMASTDIDVLDFHKSSFCFKRNSLCIKCQDVGIHRIK